MDMDMDIDMDLDLGPDPEIAALEEEAMRMVDETAAPPVAFQPFGTGEATIEMQQDGTLVPEKVHIRGLDNLSTAEIKDFAREHFSMNNFVKVEWIDDTSANLIYESAEAALQALHSFTATVDVDPSSLSPLQTRPAKSLSKYPNIELQVRQSLSTDVKKARAHEASRYYLMHPEHDPREQKSRDRRQRRYSDEKGDYRRRRFDEREHKRRRDGDEAARFDESMYDDGIGETSRDDRRHNSRSDSNMEDNDERSRKKVRFNRRGGDLFSAREGWSSDGRLRNRSASPERNGDGRLGFSEDENSIRRRIRQRSLTPPAHRQRDAVQVNSGKELFAARVNNGRELFPTQQNTVKELFPSQGGLKSFLSQQPATGAKELFPSKLAVASPATPTTPKELFPNKTAISNHRRTDAVHTEIKSPDLFSNGPLSARSLADRISINGPLSGKSLADRIGVPRSGRPASFGEAEAQRFGARPASTSVGMPGISIRDVSLTSGDGSAKPARELFPLKAGSNTGKELFAEKLKGRGGPRRKAEDMYF